MNADDRAVSSLPAPQIDVRQAIDEGTAMTSVDELQARGVRKLKVISESRINERINQAVAAAIERYMSENRPPEGDLARIRADARREFGVLLKEMQEDAKAASREMRDFFRRELDLQKSLLEPGAPKPSSPALAVDSPEFREFQDRMAENISKLIAADWKSDLDDVRMTQRQKIEALENRLSKLLLALESTERVLASLQGRGGRRGAPPPKSPLGEQKSMLLREIFNANLELQKLEHDLGSE
ncbi:MAG: hypothetical protein JXP34_04895 [Planctomycetes bacterium]|nr:hypothetical protein [Planctomycetota bacterium]